MIHQPNHLLWKLHSVKYTVAYLLHTQLHGTRTKVVPVHAMNAYRGAETQLQSLTLALHAG
jgi:hypothetical protein